MSPLCPQSSPFHGLVVYEGSQKRRGPAYRKSREQNRTKREGERKCRGTHTHTKGRAAVFLTARHSFYVSPLFCFINNHNRITTAIYVLLNTILRRPTLLYWPSSSFRTSSKWMEKKKTERKTEEGEEGTERRPPHERLRDLAAAVFLIARFALVRFDAPAFFGARGMRTVPFSFSSAHSAATFR